MDAVYFKHEQSAVTLETLATVMELAKAVMREVTGNELADTVNGQALTDNLYNQLIAARIRTNMQLMTQSVV